MSNHSYKRFSSHLNELARNQYLVKSLFLLLAVVSGPTHLAASPDQSIARITFNDHIELTRGVDCEVALLVAEDPRLGGRVPFVTVNCRGSQRLSAPVNIAFNLAGGRHSSGGTTTNSVIVDLEILIDSTWVKPNGVRDREKGGEIATGLSRFNVPIYPGAEPAHSQFFFFAFSPPRKIRLAVIHGPVFQFDVPELFLEDSYGRRR